MMALPDPQTQPDFYEDVSFKRLLAWSVDALVTFIGCLVVLPFTFFAGLFVFPLLFLVIGFFYRVVTIANGSATWGMRLFSIELRSALGTKLDLSGAFLHTLGYTISWAVAPVQLISMALMATTERGQGLTDFTLGTVMVNRRAAHR